jgi:hypothetical protein
MNIFRIIQKYFEAKKTMKMDYEDILYDLSVEEIKLFAKKHQNETFYGFGIDCHAEHGQVILCFHSIEALEKISEKPSEAELQNRKVFAEISKSMHEKHKDESGGEDLYQEPVYNDDPEYRKSKLKWSLGDWLYQGTDGMAGHLNESSWKKKWSPISDEIEESFFDDEDADEDFDEKFRIQFLTLVFRTLLKIEQSGVLELLNKTEDFNVLIIDHDQTEEDAWSFMKEMRAKHA